jgi:hypothetical protein
MRITEKQKKSIGREQHDAIIEKTLQQEENRCLPQRQHIQIQIIRRCICMHDELKGEGNDNTQEI